MKKIFLIITLMVIASLLYLSFSESSPARNYQFVNDVTSTGFVEVDCWFTPGSDWPRVECYRMWVPENYAKPEARLISFPVVIFRNFAAVSDKSPVLHLGAGGPGAPMYLDSSYAVDEFWRMHDAMSVNIGRDLVVIDPRGTGLSEPLLVCDRFVDNELIRFRYNLSLEEEMIEVNKDYYDCIEDFNSEGIDLAEYNSFTIARDIEAIRQATAVEQWVLIGVSYGASYAQTIAHEFPHTVESMVLDSATFPRVKMHNNYIERITAPFVKLYNYCDSDPECDQPVRNIKKSIWNIYENLSERPITVQLEHPYDYGSIPFVLNGERFLASLFQGIYSVEIYQDLPLIISELEAGRYESLLPYIALYADYMLDRNYGDVSAAAHYCFDDKPFIDFKLIKELNDDLPEGYIRDTAMLTMDWPDFCEEMRIETGADELVLSSPTDIPSLFLHGRFDTVTPLSDVVANQSYFKNHRLVTFDLSHSILSSSECAEVIAGKFISDYSLEQKELVC